jgi:hypothetical protein
VVLELRIKLRSRKWIRRKAAHILEWRVRVMTVKKRKERSTTRWMLDVLGSDKPGCLNLPPEFLCGLRAALDAGLTCEQITAVIVLFTGVYEAGEKMSGPELLERAKVLSASMVGDITSRQDELEQRKKNEAFQRKLLSRGSRKS